MKKLLFIIAVLLLGLATCGGGIAFLTGPLLGGASSPVAIEKVSEGAAAPLLTPTAEPVPEGEPFEAVELTLIPAGDPVAGGKLFASACAGCHGQDMAQNEFIAANTDRELVEFFKAGGVPGEPPVMPPRAGNPSLSDDKLHHIVAYLRSLQK